MHIIYVVQTKYSLFINCLLTSPQGGISKVSMSSTGSSKGAAQKSVGGEAAQKEVITNNVQFYLFVYTCNYYTQDMSQFETLLANLEAEYFAIMKDLMKKKCGQPLTDFLKVILECSICKGLITKV